MSARLFTNGAVVNRIWGDLTDAEVIGAFQYSGDAETFAKAKLAEDASRDFHSCAYAVCCHYTGKLNIFRHQAPEKSA